MDVLETLKHEPEFWRILGTWAAYGAANGLSKMTFSGVGDESWTPKDGMTDPIDGALDEFEMHVEIEDGALDDALNEVSWHRLEATVKSEIVQMLPEC